MALGETAAGRPPAEDDDPDHDDIVDHVPQAVDTKKLMGEGWQFEAPTTGELEEPQSADSKKKYFEGLAKLNEDGHSLAEYCNGLGLDDDDHAGQQPFAVLRARMEDLLGDGGIMKLVEAPGDGGRLPPEVWCLSTTWDSLRALTSPTTRPTCGTTASPSGTWWAPTASCCPASTRPYCR